MGGKGFRPEFWKTALATEWRTDLKGRMEKMGEDEVELGHMAGSLMADSRGDIGRRRSPHLGA